MTNIAWAKSILHDAFAFHDREKNIISWIRTNAQNQLEEVQEIALPSFELTGNEFEIALACTRTSLLVVKIPEGSGVGYVFYYKWEVGRWVKSSDKMVLCQGPCEWLWVTSIHISKEGLRAYWSPFLRGENEWGYVCDGVSPVIHRIECCLHRLFAPTFSSCELLSAQGQSLALVDATDKIALLLPYLGQGSTHRHLCSGDLIARWDPFGHSGPRKAQLWQTSTYNPWPKEGTTFLLRREMCLSNSQIPVDFFHYPRRPSLGYISDIIVYDTEIKKYYILRKDSSLYEIGDNWFGQPRLLVQGSYFTSNSRILQVGIRGLVCDAGSDIIFAQQIWNGGIVKALQIADKCSWVTEPMSSV